MKIMKQNAELLDTTGMTQYQIIERVGRTCYKSEDKIAEGSAERFVKTLYKSKHHAMLEFGFIYVEIVSIDLHEFIMQSIPNTSYLHLADNFISGSFRAWYDYIQYLIQMTEMIPGVYEDYAPEILDLVEAFSVKYPEIFKDIYEKFRIVMDDEDYDYDAEECDPDEIKYPFRIREREDFIQAMKSHDYPNIMYSAVIPHIVKFTTNRGIANELVRHRLCSFAQESTRYCNYANDKFGNEITLIEPMLEPNSEVYQAWVAAMNASEAIYNALIKNDVKAQIARGVLPLDLKTDIWIACTEDEWQHILDLRLHGTTGSPHPQIKELMDLVYN